MEPLEHLAALHRDHERWWATAAHSEAGWPHNYPRRDELKAAVEAVRVSAAPSQLSMFLNHWARWSETADRSEEGWQTDYPQMGELVVVAEGLMSGVGLDEATLRDLDRYWAITEEDELLADFAREQIERCWPVLRWLIVHGHRDTRWQVAAVLGAATRITEAEGVLRAALDDPDTHVCRCALLSLARFAPHDARELAERFLRDPDPYLRQAAIEMVLATSDSTFIVEARRILLDDPVWHVRKAANAIDVSRDGRQ